MYAKSLSCIFHETKSEHVWLEMYRHLTWMNMSFQLSANMAPVRFYEQVNGFGRTWKNHSGVCMNFEYNSKKGGFRRNYMSFNEFVHCEHKNLWRRRRRSERYFRRAAQGGIESIFHN